MESASFSREEHIKRPADFKNLFKNGKRASVAGAKLFYLPNQLGFNRIGFPHPVVLAMQSNEIAQSGSVAKPIVITKHT